MNGRCPRGFIFSPFWSNFLFFIIIIIIGWLIGCFVHFYMFAIVPLPQMPRASHQLNAIIIQQYDHI